MKKENGKTKTTNIMFPKNLWFAAKVLALRDETSLGEIVRRALKKYIEAEGRPAVKK